MPMPEPSRTTVRPWAPAQPLPAPGLGRFLLELAPAPAQGLARTGLRSARDLVVTPDGGPIAAALAEELRARGIPARCVETVPASADAVIFLGGLREVESEAQALAINHEAFCAARAAAPRLCRAPGLLVTVQDTGGGFGLTPCPPLRALLAGLPALLKTARKEWPQASAVAIDLQRSGRAPGDLARILADELLAGGGELEIALPATGQRWTLCARPAALQTGLEGHPIGQGDVVVVTGGARGVTAGCVVEWARWSRARFALLGRTALVEEPACCAGRSGSVELKEALRAQVGPGQPPPSPQALARQVAAILAGREIRATLAAIAQVGGSAQYFPVDVQDPAGVAATLEQIRAGWGPVTALVHAAGVLADRSIAHLDDAAFHRVFDTKVAGLQALLAATAGDPLKVLCLFSSVAARSGNNGQAAYAMGNEVLNKVAQCEARRRGPETLVKSLVWGPWEGGGMVPARLMALFRKVGVPLLPLAAGARMFVEEVTRSDRQGVEVILGMEPRSESLAATGLVPRTLELEVRVDRDSHGFLAASGAAEVPLALVVEWLSRTAGAFRPELRLSSIDGFRVHQDLCLDPSLEPGQTFTLRCTEPHPVLSAASLDLEILGAGRVLHCQARAEMVMGAPPPALPPWTRWGGAMQVVAHWAGGIQGGPARPVGFTRLRLGHADPQPGASQVVARCRRRGPSRVVADLQVADAAGRPWADLLGVELVQ